jgi:lipopolysaccharide transport system ATP-binding protein
VAFNMMVRTVTGVGLAGAQTAAATRDEGLSVEAGTRVDVAFDFDCLCLPGVYFVTARVVGKVADEVKVLHRIADGAVFRVLPEPRLLATGLADFRIAARIATGKAEEGPC